MQMLKCYHFLLKRTVTGLYNISGDSHIDRNVDKSTLLKFVELPEPEWSKTSDRMLAVHTAFIRSWNFNTEAQALAVWEICIEPLPING